VKFAFIATHRGIWPAGWLCEALGVSRAGFYAWRTRPPSVRARADEQLLIRVRASFLTSDRTYGARRVWHDMLVEGIAGGLHRIERLMRHAVLRARPRRRRMPSDTGVRSTNAVAPNVLNRTFDASSANRKWVADFTYLWTGDRVVHECDDDRAAGHRCTGDGDLAAGHAPHRAASLRSREPVYE
jgi:putative transposase